jgi:hypothetical protein
MKGTAVIHAHQLDAADDRFRDPPVYRVLPREPAEHTSGSDLGRHDSHGSVRPSRALCMCRSFLMKAPCVTLAFLRDESCRDGMIVTRHASLVKMPQPRNETVFRLNRSDGFA